jgi:hypothetical protein
MPDTETYTDNTHLVEDEYPELNSRLDEIRNVGMKVTNTWKEMWTTAFKYTWGQMLENIKPKEDWNYIVVNRIYPLMMSTVSKLAKNNPKVLVFPWSSKKEGAADFAEKWAGALQYIWESPYELNMRLKLIQGLLQAALFGYMVGKTYWDKQVDYDEESRKDVGNVRHDFIHPTTFWVDPSAETLERAQNCGTQRRVTLEWAQSRWSEYKDQIEKEAYTADDPKYVEGFEIIFDSQKASTLETNPKMMFTKIVNLILHKGLHKQTGPAGETSKQKYVTVEEIYFKDYTKRHVKQEDFVSAQKLIDDGIITRAEENGQNIEVATGKLYDKAKWPKEVIDEYDERVYPKGRFVLRIGKTILNPDEKEQKYRYSRWPFTVMPYHVLPFMWQGCNAVEMAKNNNDMLNLTISALVHRVRLAADPERIVEDGALATDREGNVRQRKPRGLGKFIVTNIGKMDKIKNMDYGKLDPSLILLSQILKQDIDDSMFSQDVARGAGSNKTPMQRGTGKMTATEASKLDVNSHDYTAMQAIFLDGFIDLTLTTIAEVVQSNYPEGRMITIVGSDREERTKEALTKEMLDVRFDVNIVPGSTMPFDKERKKEEYAMAFKILANPMPHPMLEEMLQVLNISNRKKILLRHQGTILFAQFVQMAQMLTQVDPAEVQAALKLIPELMPLVQLMQQAAQLQIPVEGPQEAA